MIELQAINKIIQFKDVDLLKKFTVDYFPRYKNEYLFILEHYNKNNNIPDPETFLTKFPKFNYVQVDEPSSFIAKELIKEKTKSNIIDIFNSVKEAFTAGDIEKARLLIENAKIDADKISDLHVVDILKDTSRYGDYIDKCGDFEKYYVKTGFDELDAIIGGWDRYEELGTIVARGGVGKSWFLFKSATAAVKQGLTTGIFSGEMSDSKVGYRIDTLLNNTSNFSLTKGNSDIQVEYRRYIEELPTKYKAPLYILTPSDRQLGVSDLRKFIEDYKLDILFVDQHSLLLDEHHAQNPIQAATNISKDLKNLQVLKRIPIITASQQNRSDTEETGVSLKNISQSDRIGQDSTVVLFAEQKDSKFILTLVKSRDSSNNKKLSYAVDLDKGIFEYIPSEDELTESELSSIEVQSTLNKKDLNPPKLEECPF